MLEIADRVGQINERALQRGNQQLNALFGRLQMGLLAMIALTLIGGAAIAGQASFVILRLQGEVRKRLEEATEARASLRDFPQNWSAPRKTSGARFPENCTTKPPSLSRPY